MKTKMKLITSLGGEMVIDLSRMSQTMQVSVMKVALDQVNTGQVLRDSEGRAYTVVDIKLED
jgi:hypothetical protein